MTLSPIPGEDIDSTGSVTEGHFIFVFRFQSSVEPTISDPGTGWSAAAYRKKFVWELKRGFAHDGGPPAVSISPFPLLLTST